MAKVKILRGGQWVEIESGSTARAAATTARKAEEARRAPIKRIRQIMDDIDRARDEDFAKAVDNMIREMGKASN